MEKKTKNKNKLKTLKETTFKAFKKNEILYVQKTFYIPRYTLIFFIVALFR